MDHRLDRALKSVARPLAEVRGEVDDAFVGSVAVEPTVCLRGSMRMGRRSL
jgi:hypothetical protein